MAVIVCRCVVGRLTEIRRATGTSDEAQFSALCRGALETFEQIAMRGYTRNQIMRGIGMLIRSSIFLHRRKYVLNRLLECWSVAQRKAKSMVLVEQKALQVQHAYANDSDRHCAVNALLASSTYILKHNSRAAQLAHSLGCLKCLCQMVTNNVKPTVCQKDEFLQEFPQNRICMRAPWQWILEKTTNLSQCPHDNDIFGNIYEEIIQCGAKGCFAQERCVEAVSPMLSFKAHYLMSIQFEVSAQQDFEPMRFTTNMECLKRKSKDREKCFRKNISAIHVYSVGQSIIITDIEGVRLKFQISGNSGIQAATAKY